EAGYPDGFKVTLHCPNDRYVNDAATCQTAGVLLARIGVTVAIDAQPSSVYFPRLQRPEYSFYLLAWGSNGGDATSFLRDVMETRDLARGVGSWNMGLSMPDVDQAIDAATLTMDETVRNREMAAVMGLLIQRQAYIPLDTLLVIAAARKPVTYQPQATEEMILSAVGRQ
ncbi:MAG TPA: ABC transporter substrate-binding protein, partial [Acetobacteraceae bacterium]